MKNKPYMISEAWEYECAQKMGHEPLIDDVHFTLPHRLRVNLQRERFGGNNPQGNEKFYRFCWKWREHVCEECLRPLEYSAAHVSHILSRGAHPEMAHDPRNVNILCFAHHEQWEHETTRRAMRIFERNKRKIEQLKNEYNGQ